MYLTALGPRCPGPGDDNMAAADQSSAVWELRLREGGTVRRLTLTPAGLQQWAEGQPPAVRARVDELRERIGRPRKSIEGSDYATPVLMGIINVTPDSFSDGGEHADAEGAVAHGRRLAEAGARILDIGGESTRPGAAAVGPAEEIRRVLPVIRALQELRRQSPKIALSIDTRHAATMRAALEAGIDIINDVSALTGDRDSLKVAAASRADIVLMHMQGEPATMNLAPAYADVALDVFDYLESRIEACAAAGIDRRRLIADPGIGFGKRGPENLAILRDLGLFHGLGCPILLGVSRKGFGDSTQALAPKDRLPTSIAAATIAAARGVQILRVHDVAETLQALAIWRGIAGSKA
jgi:dihydropteroate synthase